MKKAIKLLSVVIPLTFCISSGVANANVVDAPANFGSGVYSFTNIFSLNASDYVSEPSIFSDTINFSLDSAQTVTFFADTFSGAFKFHQIDLLYAAGNFIDGISQDVGTFKFSHDLLPGNYQVNFKGAPDVWDYNDSNYQPDYNLGGSYHASVFMNTPAVPEPKTYLMLLAGLALIGFTARRQCWQ